MARPRRRAHADERGGIHLPSLARGRFAAPQCRDWTAVTTSERARMARWATVAAAFAISVTNCFVGLETFLLVQLAFNGGRLDFASTVGAPNFPAVVFAILVGVGVNLLLGLGLLKPQLRWFVDGRPANQARRRAVQRIPMIQVLATFGAWSTAVLCYLLAADDLTTQTVFGVAVAFGLAGVSSSCITYVFAERAARPLAVVALHDNPTRHVIHGVRSRMIAVWAVSSAVPMVGLLIINAGRWADWLPPVQGPIDWTTVVLAIVGLVAGARVVALVGTSLADPLTDLRRAVEQVDRGDLSAQVAVYDSSELGVLQHGFNEMVTGLDERDRMRELFARHVGDTVADLALERGAGMHGTNALVGVLFVDIVGSTTVAAQQDPQETVALLNRFFTIVAEVVDQHSGFVNKFEGDAALAVFGVPVAVTNPAAAALGAARDLARRLRELPIGWGIGVSYGLSFAGNVGAERRYEYTVIGNPVNECARLSELAKGAEVPVLAGEGAVAAAGDDERPEWRAVGARRLRGRSEAIEVYVPAAMVPTSEATGVGGVLSGLLRPRRSVVGGLIRLPLTLIGR
ncbi:adenylate/guanylate cyclase domain-containing protein [Gordonia rhizosphera]|uniref:Putative adenylate cyclase n=1 Tax=Gordonia rhizosphera NBRC 16068 TaxID=1108045 RepID=K6WQ78_9ACTN|nr:putative adenylate cyclase [Gordonia rhizosphera NBRC 16068]